MRDQVTKIAGKCADYFNKVFEQLGSKYTAETFGQLFDRVGMGRIKIDHNEFVKAGEPTASGIARDNPPRIYVNDRVTAVARIVTFELFHLAGGFYTDYRMDDAVIALMDPNKRKDAVDEKEGKKGPYKRATIWKRMFNEECFRKINQ